MQLLLNQDFGLGSSKLHLKFGELFRVPEVRADVARDTLGEFRQTLL